MPRPRLPRCNAPCLAECHAVSSPSRCAASARARRLHDRPIDQRFQRFPDGTGAGTCGRRQRWGRDARARHGGRRRRHPPRAQRRGRDERVRLIGIDAPERSTTRTGFAECGGQEATDARTTSCGGFRGGACGSLPTPARTSRDRFGRILAYVEPARGSSSTLQEEMLRAGWARVYVYDRDPFTRVRAFRAAARQARDAGRGVWRSCGGSFTRPAS